MTASILSLLSALLTAIGGGGPVHMQPAIGAGGPVQRSAYAMVPQPGQAGIRVAASRLG